MQSNKSIPLIPENFKGYKNVLDQMKNDPDKTLKKEVITDAWLSIKKAKLATREQIYSIDTSSLPGK